MGSIIKEYEYLIKEVKNLNKRIISESKNDLEICKYYRGCQILFSPIFKKSEVLFIGINPGSGFYNTHNERYVRKYSPIKVIDYLNENMDYDLSKQTYEIFKMTGIGEYEDILGRSVKTNFYYFATQSDIEIPKMAMHFSESLYNDFYNKSVDWTKRIIEMCHPKIIMCEGFKAFELINRNIKLSEVKKLEYILTGKYDSTKVIGYKRNHSQILKKEIIASVLKNELITMK